MLITRVFRIFRRYAQTQVALDHPAGALGNAGLRIDRHALRGPRLILEGHLPPQAAHRIGLSLGVDTQWTAPDAEGRFRFDMPASVEAPVLRIEGADLTQTHPLRAFDATQVRAAERRMAGRFAAILLRHLPAIARWKLGGDMGAREAVKEALGLSLHRPAAVIDASLLVPPAPRPAPPFAAVTVVMPVFNALDMLREALARLEAHTDMPWRLVVIEDASTDPALRPWLRDWAATRADRVQLLENATNLGFIGSVNRGLARAREGWPGDPVVLLNSDAMLPEGWVARLLAPLADPAVASVTPLSNDAEIFIVPVICARHDLAPGQGDALDKAAQSLSAGLSRPTAPTGVGFAMALAPRFLAQVPGFDTAFGRGYGEEVDWCRKTAALGGVHVCAHELFVEHRGGASFGSAAKQRLLERNGAEIARRYPDYDGAVMGFVAADPLTTPRLALGLSWAGLAQEDPVPVYLGHAMGGGADHWLGDRILEATGAGRSAVVLRVGQGRRWRLELHTPQGMTAGLSDDFAPVSSLISRLPRRRIIYSCGVGDSNAAELPDLLLALAGQGAHPIEVLFHDFFPISPSFTLRDADGVFRAVPRGDGRGAQDPAHRYRAMGGAVTSLADWQAAWGRLIAAADRVTVFSEDSRAHVLDAYPQAEQSLIVAPHALRAAIPRIARPGPGAQGPAIGIPGHIGAQKGAEVLQRLSRDLAALGPGAPRLVVLGHLAPEYHLTAPSHVHGPYRLEDLPGLVARHGIQAWFIPSVWPETFSFTTHEALATGLPVLAFDLGAQGAAVAVAKNGHLLPRQAMTEPDLARTLTRILADLS